MKVPTRALAVLGVLWQVLVALAFLGGVNVPAFSSLLWLLFLCGCPVCVYSFLAWLHEWFGGRTQRAYVTWLRRGGENKK